MSYKVVYDVLTEEEKNHVYDILEKNGNSKLDILNTLLEIQEILPAKYIGERVCEIVSEKTGYTKVELYDMITFYSMLHTKPRAKHIIEVCNCGSCYINDSEALITLLERKLGIKKGEHTYDWLFELTTCPCVGACDIGPVIKIGENIYGGLNEQKVMDILKELYEKRDH